MGSLSEVLLIVCTLESSSDVCELTSSSSSRLIEACVSGITTFLADVSRCASLLSSCTSELWISYRVITILIIYIFPWNEL